MLIFVGSFTHGANSVRLYRTASRRGLSCRHTRPWFGVTRPEREKGSEMRLCATLPTRYGYLEGALDIADRVIAARQESRTGADSLVPAEMVCATSQGDIATPNRGEPEGV